jgi:SNF2 family DNA or RNA helicase
MHVKTDDHFMYVTGAYREDLRRLLSFHNAVKTVKGYRLPLNLWSAREVYNDFPEVQDLVYKAGVRLKKEFDELLEQRRMLDDSPFSAIYDARLRDYQSADVSYLMKLNSAGVFNEQRTGKTPTMITLLKELKPAKALVVCPASLVYNWQREVVKWHPDINVYVANGTKTKRESVYYSFDLDTKEKVMIVSKDTLKTDKSFQSYLFDVIIVDEAHFLRNYKTAQSKAIFQLKAKRRYALTGTPTVKHPSDIFGILHFLHPEKYPSYWQFAERYFHIEDNYKGYKEVLSEKKHRIEELQQLIGIISVQRKRRDVMKWLPDKERSTFYCQMTGKQKKAYDEMLQYFFVEEAEVDAPSVLAQLIRLRQICLDPALLGIDAPSAKTDALMEWIENNIVSGECVVIMSMFTSYLKMLFATLTEKHYKVGMIHGEMSNAAKMQAADDFQKGKTNILLCNIISAGTGFTLDRAETIIFLDKAYNPAENEQAEDRITPTTTDNVHKHSIISFVCQSSVDERINELLERKKSLTDLVNEGGLKAIKNLLRK